MDTTIRPRQQETAMNHETIYPAKASWAITKVTGGEIIGPASSDEMTGTGCSFVSAVCVSGSGA